jgi:hypothetical protein
MKTRKNLDFKVMLAMCRVDVYSLKRVPKSLQGKGEGWNRKFALVHILLQSTLGS